jgi:hypothetical protein
VGWLVAGQCLGVDPARPGRAGYGEWIVATGGAVSGVPIRFAALRTLLLVLVALGVLGMHTTGHPDDSHGVGTRTASHEMPAMQAPAAIVNVALMAVPPGSGGDFDSLAVCMAVLTAVGLAALIGWAMLAVRRTYGGVAPVPSVLAGLGRGPPWRCHGLVLADLSVQRR